MLANAGFLQAQLTLQTQALFSEMILKESLNSFNAGYETLWKFTVYVPFDLLTDTPCLYLSYAHL